MQVQKMTLAQVKAHVRKYGSWDGWLMPCKMYSFDHFGYRIQLSMNCNGDLIDDRTNKAFVTSYNAWAYYNCTYETGYYAHYYMIK